MDVSAARRRWGAVGLGALCAVVLLARAAPSQRQPVSQREKGAGAMLDLQLSSPAFEPDTAIPVKHTGLGADTSPPLQWTDPPKGTAAFAIICEDPDAPRGTWVHWVLYDLPGDLRSLEEGVPKSPDLTGSARQGVNDFRRIGYGGPMPPPGSEHHYVFALYALSKPTGLSPGATKVQVMEAIQGKILARAELVGTFRR